MAVGGRCAPFRRRTGNRQRSVGELSEDPCRGVHDPLSRGARPPPERCKTPSGAVQDPSRTLGEALLSCSRPRFPLQVQRFRATSRRRSAEARGFPGRWRREAFGAGWKAHVCLPGSASPPACRGSASPPACRGPASPPACRGRSSKGDDRRPIAPRLPNRPLCATEPARRAHSCQVAPLIGQKKTRHLPTATRPKPDRPDNPNRPVSILSSSEPALCALAPVPDHQAAPVPAR